MAVPFGSGVGSPERENTRQRHGLERDAGATALVPVLHLGAPEAALAEAKTEELEADRRLTHPLAPVRVGAIELLGGLLGRRVDVAALVDERRQGVHLALVVGGRIADLGRF